MESRRVLDEFPDVIRDADQTFLDPEKELGTQGRVDFYPQRGPAASRATPRRCRARPRIGSMAMFFQHDVDRPLRVELLVNEFCPPFEFDAEQGGTVDNVYCFRRFRLMDDEYLKVTFRSPDACYWDFRR